MRAKSIHDARHDSGERTAPACVNGRNGFFAGRDEQNRHAIGRSDGDRNPRRGGDQGIGVTRVIGGRGLDDHHVGTMNLRGAHQSQVLGYRSFLRSKPMLDAVPVPIGSPVFRAHRRFRFLADRPWPPLCGPGRTGGMRSPIAVFLAVSLVLVPRVPEAADEGVPADYRVTVDLGEAIRLLASEEAFERASAMELLELLGPSALPALGVALANEGTAVRRGVVEVLTSIEAPGVTVLLVRHAETDPSVEVRAAAISALVERDASEAGPIVEAAFRSDDPREYRSAIHGCGRHCQTPQELDRLVTLAFTEPEPEFTRGPRAALGRAARDPSLRADVRAALERGAVDKLGDPKAGTRIRAGLLFFDIDDPRAIDGLNGAFSDDASPLLRLQAFGAIGRVGDSDTVERLAAIWPDIPPPLHRGACKLLAKLAQRDVSGAAKRAESGGCVGAR